MSLLILNNATIVTGKLVGTGAVAIEDDRIRSVVYSPVSEDINGVTEAALGAPLPEDAKVIDLTGKLLFAGGVDAHVHFREPGLTWKADMESESRAALLGGVTTFFDMPNTVPQTVSMQAVEDKAALAAGRAWANYGFHFGATNDNLAELVSAVERDRDKFPGIKVFLGSSTGNMKVEDEEILDKIFSIKGKTISVHAENDEIIRQNLERFRTEYGEAIPVSLHPLIRAREACIDSTRKVLRLALKHDAALHILHVSTAEEVDMIAEARRLNPRITAETSANYLWFCDEDYARLGAKIKCNPAIKSASDRTRLIEALRSGEIDTIGSDHAPHLASEKMGIKYNSAKADKCKGAEVLKSEKTAADNKTEGDFNINKPVNYNDLPSGIPSIQQTLPVLLTLARRENIPLERIASVFSEKPAEIFGVRDRGRIKAGCFADLVIVDPEIEWTVSKVSLQSKCGWTPYEGERLTGRVVGVIVNGRFVAGPMAKIWYSQNENIKNGLCESGNILNINDVNKELSLEKTAELTVGASIGEETIVGSPHGMRVVFD